MIPIGIPLATFPADADKAIQRWHYVAARQPAAMMTAPILRMGMAQFIRVQPDA